MASYYWVGGSGTWDNSSKTNWATVSGGAGGNGPPTNADLVFFDANSGTAATVTVAATAVSTSTTVDKSDIVLSLSGSPTLCITAGALTLTSGTITLNNNTLTVGAFSSDNSNVRTINFGTGNITLTANNGIIWNFTTATNFACTGTPTVNTTYSGSTGTRTLRHGTTAGGTEANSVSFNISAGSDTILFTNSATNAQRSVNFTGFTGTLSNSTWFCYGDLTLGSGMTVQAGVNSINLNATSGTQKITSNGVTINCPVNRNGAGGTLQLQDNMTVSSTNTFALLAGGLDLTGNSGNWTLSTGIFSSSATAARSIAFGTGNITVTGNNATVFTTSTATNFSYTGTPTINLTYSGSTGTRTIAAHSTAGTETNTLNFNISAGTDTVALTSTFVAKNINFTGFAGTLTNTSVLTYGNVTYAAGMTLTAGTNATTFAATSGTQQITTNGKTLDFPLTFNGVGGTFAFQDALTMGSTRTLTLTNGTLQLKNGVTSTVGTFATSGTNQKVLRSTTPGSQATLSDAAGTLNLTYLTVRDIAATGGAQFNALNNCITQGNNSGWYFAPQLGRPLPAFAF